MSPGATRTFTESATEVRVFTSSSNSLLHVGHWCVMVWSLAAERNVFGCPASAFPDLPCDSAAFPGGTVESCCDTRYFVGMLNQGWMAVGDCVAESSAPHGDPFIDGPHQDGCGVEHVGDTFRPSDGEAHGVECGVRGDPVDVTPVGLCDSVFHARLPCRWPHPAHIEADHIDTLRGVVERSLGLNVEVRHRFCVVFADDDPFVVGCHPGGCRPYGAVVVVAAEVAVVDADVVGLGCTKQVVGVDDS